MQLALQAIPNMQRGAALPHNDPAWSAPTGMLISEQVDCSRRTFVEAVSYYPTLLPRKA